MATPEEKDAFIALLLENRNPGSTYTIHGQFDKAILHELQDSGYLIELGINNNWVHIGFNYKLPQFKAAGGYTQIAAIENLLKPSYKLTELNALVQKQAEHREAISKAADVNDAVQKQMQILEAAKKFVPKEAEEKPVIYPSRKGEQVTHIHFHGDVKAGNIVNGDNHGIQASSDTQAISSSDEKPVWQKILIWVGGILTALLVGFLLYKLGWN